MNQASRDMLISRVAGGEACDEEWERLTALADEDPTVWRDVAETQRDAVSLECVVDAACDVAERVALPPRRHLAWSLGSWGGWAVAAAVGLAWVIQFGRPAAIETDPLSTTTQAASLSLGSAADAIQAYLNQGPEQGEVVGELPTKLLVDSRPSATGQGYELLYVRQVLERTVVVDLYEFNGADEWGKPALMRPRRAAPGAY